MATVGEAIYKISYDANTGELKAKLANGEKEIGASAERANSKLSSTASKAGKALATAAKVATAAATAAVTAITVQSSKLYADNEQLVGGVETLFKDSANDVIKNADKAFQTAQISANDYMETVTGFSASLLQSLGGDTKKAAELADMALIDMADNANKMGTSMESIKFAYQGFAKQNYTMLDNLKLGYGGTKTEMERLLADAEKLSGVHYEIGNYGDMVQAIHVIQEQMGIAGTSAKEASETISGSFNTMKAAWTNLLTDLGKGNDISGRIEELVASVGQFGKNLLPVVKNILKGVATLIRDLAPEIGTTLKEMIPEVLPAIIEAATGILTALIEVLPDLLVTLVDALIAAIPTLIDSLLRVVPLLLQAMIQIINAIVQQLPVIIPQLLNMIIEIAKMLTSPQFLSQMLNAWFTLFVSLVDALPDIIITIIEALPDIITNIISFLTDPANIGKIIEGAVKLFTGIVIAVPRILGALIGAFGKLVGNLWNGITKMFGEFAGRFGEFIGGIFKGAINGVLGFIENIINGPIDIINGFIGAINGAFGFIGVHLGRLGRIRLPRMATGGIVPSTNGGRIILAGEGGQDEWVVPESKMASLIDQINARGAGMNVTINVSGTFATSISEQRKVAEVIAERLQEVQKSRLNAGGTL